MRKRGRHRCMDSLDYTCDVKCDFHKDVVVRNCSHKDAVVRNANHKDVVIRNASHKDAVVRSGSLLHRKAKKGSSDTPWVSNEFIQPYWLPLETHANNVGY